MPWDRRQRRLRNQIRDNRQIYADEVVAALVLDAGGGTPQAYAETAEKLAGAVAAFGRFANAALDAYHVRHRSALEGGAVGLSPHSVRNPGRTAKTLYRGFAKRPAKATKRHIAPRCSEPVEVQVLSST
jgi:hypothetical protein